MVECPPVDNIQRTLWSRGLRGSENVLVDVEALGKQRIHRLLTAQSKDRATPWCVSVTFRI
jgi:hypothetical protein